ncbi:MAG: type II toxin-antitoxin system RelE/ParE family toxin [Lentisphaerae bacterium]|mgnify:FL=1|jgi:phage-related protein|nr:type II toxin-antitoxin system RelE/ParE family toxin [Lentisphaerota bacterium]MBT7846394.1 type II toxin-antitoxin system RelE/ParE family toxin [Lentisphaerota bacterium]
MNPKRTYVALPKVREFIQEQPPDCQMEYQAIVDRLESDGFLLEPYGKKLEPELFEIRVRTGRKIRVFYCYHDDNIVFGVHAFVKKTQRTPARELRQARRVIGRIKRGEYDG